MRFIIDQVIYFRPADGAIWHSGSENEKRYLTPASSRLLVLLIERQGEVLSRNDIFLEVWERYGLYSSNNTLNQYISLLRRTLADYGSNTTIIKTIPKTGFLLNKDIEIIKETEKTLPHEKNYPLAKERLYKNTIIILLLLVLVIFLWGLYGGI